MKVPKVHAPFWFRLLCVKAWLRWVAWSGRTVVLGAWRSELGFEVLYWLPFIHWAQHYAKIPKSRCLAVSRGGMGALYPAEDYADLYTLRSVDEVRLQNQIEHERTKLLKQLRTTAWDRAVIADAVVQTHGKGHRYVVLHPSWMYWLFDGFWNDRIGFRTIRGCLRLEPLPVPPLPDGFTLPEKFVAVRFYERATFPFTGGVKDVARNMTAAIASHMPVVLLNQPDLCADDHVDLPQTGANIHLLPQIPPEQNFILQAAVMARCQAFVGTYGGVAQWALRYQKPVVSFFVDFAGTAQAHRTLSAFLAAWQKIPFDVSDLGALKLWGMSLLRVEAEAKPEAPAVEPADEAVPV